MLAGVHAAGLRWRLEDHGFYARCKKPILEQCERGWHANLERRDVGVGHVAVHILDLRQVLL